MSRWWKYEITALGRARALEDDGDEVHREAMHDYMEVRDELRRGARPEPAEYMDER